MLVLAQVAQDTQGSCTSRSPAECPLPKAPGSIDAQDQLFRWFGVPWLQGLLGSSWDDFVSISSHAWVAFLWAGWLPSTFFFSCDASHRAHLHRLDNHLHRLYLLLAAQQALSLPRSHAPARPLVLLQRNEVPPNCKLPWVHCVTLSNLVSGAAAGQPGDLEVAP